MSSTIPAAIEPPNKNHGAWLMRRIWERVNQDDEHFMGVIVGREGSGKSHTALKIASTVDPSFNADRVIFDVSELLRIFKNGDHDTGDFYVLDEAGVSLGVRTWQERGQVLANQALQLIRNHNLGLIFTLPRLSELDSQAQGRLQAFYEITEKEPDEFVTGKWKFMDPDRADQTGKIYKKYPRRRQNGSLKRITRFSFTPPADAIVEPYEKRKSEFQNEFYERTLDTLEDDDDDRDEEEDIEKITARIANNGASKLVDTHNQTGEPYINQELIRAFHDLPKSDARAVKSLLERQFSDEELASLA